MLNQTVKSKNNPFKNNPFKEYFQIQEEDNNKKFQNSISYFFKNNQFDNEITEKESNEIALETKINNQLKEKGLKRQNSIFPSSKEVNQINLKESLKDIGVLSSETEQHLMIRKLPDITDEKYNEMKNKIINDIDTLSKLYDYMNNININYKNPKSNISIGGISPLSYLIETFFNLDKEKEKEINYKYNILRPYIYNYRTIYGDGNCFYRAVIFRYLEILILNKSIKILQNFIYDVVLSFSSDILQQRRIILNEDIKPELTFKILFIIVDLLKKDMITEAHQILFKGFSTCRKFDYALVLYFRYILYDYIKKNENKIYLESFPILIGNLLPSQYETNDGKFLFDLFYENFLLKFYKDAEKIVIYLTPFVLGIELDIVVFDIEGEILQKFIYEGKSEIKTTDIITLLNKKNHYEIIYTESDEKNNKKYFEIFENNIKPNILNITQTNENDNNTYNDDNDFRLLKTDGFNSSEKIENNDNFNNNENNNINSDDKENNNNDKEINIDNKSNNDKEKNNIDNENQNNNNKEKNNNNEQNNNNNDKEKNNNDKEKNNNGKENDKNINKENEIKKNDKEYHKKNNNENELNHTDNNILNNKNKNLNQNIDNNNNTQNNIDKNIYVNNKNDNKNDSNKNNIFDKGNINKSNYDNNKHDKNENSSNNNNSTNDRKNINNINNNININQKIVNDTGININKQSNINNKIITNNNINNKKNNNIKSNFNNNTKIKSNNNNNNQININYMNNKNILNQNLTNNKGNLILFNYKFNNNQNQNKINYKQNNNINIGIINNQQRQNEKSPRINKIPNKYNLNNLNNINNQNIKNKNKSFNKNNNNKKLNIVYLSLDGSINLNNNNISFFNQNYNKNKRSTNKKRK